MPCQKYHSWKILAIFSTKKYTKKFQVWFQNTRAKERRSNRLSVISERLSKNAWKCANATNNGTLNHPSNGTSSVTDATLQLISAWTKQLSSNPIEVSKKSHFCKIYTCFFPYRWWGQVAVRKINDEIDGVNEGLKIDLRQRRASWKKSVTKST